MKQLSSWFELSHKGKVYWVEFRLSTKRWYVHDDGMNRVLKEYPWNGIYLMANMQHAEDILTEFLGIEE